MFPVVAIVGVRGIWAKGWVVPGAQTATTARTDAPPARWVWDRAELVRTLLLAAVVLAAVGTLLYVPNPIVRFVVIVAGVVMGGAATLRWVRGDR